MKKRNSDIQNKYFNKMFNELFKAKFKDAGKTQKDFAEALNALHPHWAKNNHVKHQYVSNWLNGTYPETYIDDICKVLNVDPDIFIPLEIRAARYGSEDIAEASRECEIEAMTMDVDLNFLQFICSIANMPFRFHGKSFQLMDTKGRPSPFVNLREKNDDGVCTWVFPNKEELEIIHKLQDRFKAHLIIDLAEEQKTVDDKNSRAITDMVNKFLEEYEQLTPEQKRIEDQLQFFKQYLHFCAFEFERRRLMNEKKLTLQEYMPLFLQDKSIIYDREKILEIGIDPDHVEASLSVLDNDSFVTKSLAQIQDMSDEKDNLKFVVQKLSE